MIKIEVTSTDSEVSNGQYTFGFDFLSIGYATKNDIVMRSKEWVNKEILLTITDDGLKTKVNNVTGFYLSKGKKVSGTKVHQKGESFQIENSIFKVIDFNKTQPETPSTKELYQNRCSQNPELKPLLEKIANELREHE